jgi:hypothetical protein
VTASGLGSAQPNPDDGIPIGGATAAVPTPGTTDAGAALNGRPDLTGLWWALGVLILAAAAAAGPTLVRNRRRSARLALADAGGPTGAAAAWREIEDLAVDHGIGLNPADSARAIANRLAKTAHLSDQGRTQLRAVVTMAEQGWYGGVDPADDPAAGAGSMAGSAPAAAGGATTTATLDPPATSLGAAPRALALALAHSVPLSPVDRLVPRSVRPAWWR